MKLFRSLWGALLLSGIPTLHATEVRFLPDFPESERLVYQSEAVGENNWRWYHLPDEDGREYTRRDIGVVYTPQSGETVTMIGLRLVNTQTVAGKGSARAKGQLQIYKMTEEFEMLEEPLQQVDFQLPGEQPPAGEWLTVSFPSLKLEKGEGYLFLFSFVEAGPGRWIDIATTKSTPENSGVLRQTRAGNPTIWTRSKGRAIFVLGQPR